MRRVEKALCGEKGHEKRTLHERRAEERRGEERRREQRRAEEGREERHDQRVDEKHRKG